MTISTRNQLTIIHLNLSSGIIESHVHTENHMLMFLTSIRKTIQTKPHQIF